MAGNTLHPYRGVVKPVESAATMTRPGTQVPRPHAGADSSALGEFLRARREGLRPESAGLAARGRRRTPGLRREEVAQLCGISSTWYTWVEQGRTTAVSAQTLDALAQGLQLTPAERAYLFQLAGRTDPAPPPPRSADLAQLLALTAAIRTPASVIDGHWDALAWNRAASELFTDWLGAEPVPGQGPHPNLLRYVFRHPQARAFIVDWEERARRLVAEYRADTPAWREDPWHEGLVNELSGASAAFAAAWRSQRVLARDGGERSFQHPTRGPCRYEQHILRLALRPEWRLTVLVPA
jgi:transcriptional regulator with XRE-family HTH domain